MAKTQALHPFLLAIYPPLALYAHRINEVPFEDTISTFAVLLGLSASSVLVFWLGLRDLAKAAILTSILLIWCFLYGPMRYFVEDVLLNVSVPDGYFWSAWLLGFLVLAFRTVRSRSSLALATRALNAAAITLVAWPLAGVAIDLVGRSGAGQVSAGTGAAGQGNDLEVAGAPRDIYYLIFDRYGAASTLRDEYGFDNGPFLQYLESRGFYVADDSAANYLKTAHSLASSLNMEHITYLEEQVGEDSRDYRPLYAKIQDSAVWRSLKAQGYKYIHLGSWWAPTARNEHADENFAGDAFDEFSVAVLKETAVRTIAKNTLGLPWLDKKVMQCQRVPAKFEKIKEVAEREEPTFVFAHFLIPHDPYVFEADGDCILDEDADTRSERDKYIDQVRFVNAQISELVDGLLRQSAVAPIIIIQADEGPFPGRYEENEAEFDWTEATPQEIRQKFRILNAYYLPDARPSGLHEKITPVNTFRIVFNEYFNGSFPLLPDRIYAFVDEEHLYDFFEVTETVHGAPAASATAAARLGSSVRQPR